ncbi:SDR family NAD(P)-dependent oxidoreductase [Pseudarthrobacter sp. fls2-241-R2A-168]|uniref:SDR family NAD(P)-dependent oxidoreductase n=1 Tax=Pseudarthrobacter sp. fls2-241-R2A-168 TaxID=3040304 RepID=UPI002552B4A0|nr:SDR family NAD(P)-dependent oxidoreductase [Pseudarthrobacter sp. fls2-241-R2A-168]
MKLEELQGRGAVITGSGGGMGRSIALSLAEKGMNIVIADVDSEAAAAVTEEVRKLGVNSIAVPVDVSKLDQVEALAAAAYEEFGDIAVLANNAGVTWRPFRSSWDASLEDFEWMMNVNFWGVFNGHRAFVPRMRETVAPKHIINTTSFGVFNASPGHSAYTAAKCAVDGLSRVTRAEYEAAGFNIAVSVLVPGAVKTRISTSERLRPEAERSEARPVVPWASYVDNWEALGAENKDVVTDQTRVTHNMQPIDPDWVGPMVLDGILENRAYILTHPAPEVISRQAETLASSYRQVN